MIGLKKKGDRYVLEFEQQDITDEFLSILISKFRVEQLVDKNKLTQEEAWKISEEIKENWYKTNEDWILKKAGVIDNESDC